MHCEAQLRVGWPAQAQRGAQPESGGGRALTQPAAPDLRTAKRRRTTAVEPADAVRCRCGHCSCAAETLPRGVSAI